MNPETLTLVDAAGKHVAELAVTNEEDGWFYGAILSQEFPRELKESLEQYDQVLTHQTLSFLDSALAEIERFGLSVRYPNGSLRRVFSLHVNLQDEVSFRTTPVPPPAWLTKSESA